MKLNCDLGEGFGSWQKGLDDQVMPYIDQANIACGFHAGDPDVMATTLILAKQNQVTVGAHPGYPDLVGFGRRSLSLSKTELKNCLHFQIAALQGMASVQGLSLEYVKPHGALYNDMMKDSETRQVVMASIAEYPIPLTLMLQATPQFEQHLAEAHQFNLALWFEAFADRRYDDQGLLMSRTNPKALLDKNEILEQVSQIIKKGTVQTENQRTLTLKIDTLCVHGDNPVAISQIQSIRSLIKSHV